MLNRDNDIILFLFAGLLAVLVPSGAVSQDLSFLSDTTHYLWPTEASPFISSTFGETRKAHFHAGLDIRTWGREGYKVYATRDGVVERLGISPRGYGKVIFLKHDDSSYSVYGHLNRFEESLMTLADSIRMQDYSFLLDMDMDEENIRVSQGDLIGFTGSTGIGPPHLHFELRTPDNKPFNPLLTNLSVEDDLPPVFTEIAIEHLDPETYHINTLETLRPRQTAGNYDFGSISASGPVGISVNVHDRANRTPNIYAVYELSLVLEQDTLFYSRVDSFGYGQASQMFIDRVYPLLRENRGGFQRLYLVNGNELPFYRTDNNRGIADLPEGTYDLDVIAKDFYGNKSTGSLNLVVTGREISPAGEITAIPAYPRHQIKSGMENSVSFGELQALPVNVPLLSNPETAAGPYHEQPNFETPLVYSRESTVKRTGMKLVPGKRQILYLPDQTIWIDFSKDALFDTLHVDMLVSEWDNLPVIRFSPSHIPLKKSAYLNIILQNPPVDPEVTGIYEFDSRQNKYGYKGSGFSASVLRAKIGQLGEFHVRQDQSSPYVGPPRIEKDLSGATVVNIPITDEVSGIDYHRSLVEVNGRKGIVEYNPDKNRLTYYRPGFNPLEKNRIEVWVYDRLGNLTHRLFEDIQ